MAHKTLINGTAYSVSGGKTLVNGTGYSIKNGKTLVGGTAYEVGFSNLCEVIIGYSFWGKSSVTIGDTTYGKGNVGEVVTLYLPAGTIISCQVSGIKTYTGYVKVNGDIVAETAEGTAETITYNYVLNSNVKIIQGINGQALTHGSTVEITEQ
jgi:hypothetical protein